MLPCQRAPASTCGHGGEAGVRGRGGRQAEVCCAVPLRASFSGRGPCAPILRMHRRHWRCICRELLNHWATWVLSAHFTDGETKVQGVQLFGTYTRLYQIVCVFLIFFFPNSFLIIQGVYKCRLGTFQIKLIVDVLLSHAINGDGDAGEGPAKARLPPLGVVQL